MTQKVTVDFGTGVSTVIRGEFVLPTVRVRNTGTEPISVSKRLNLFERDMCVWCVGPHGERNQLRGGIQIDSQERTTELAPEQFLEAGLSLVYTSAGIPFETPGQYRLQLEYHPNSSSWFVVSPSIYLQVLPTSDKLQGLASLTLTDNIGRALTLCSCTDSAPQPVVCDRLHSLATVYPNRREGILARFVLAKQTDTLSLDSSSLRTAFSARPPPTIARWITALVGPTSTVDTLAATFLTYLDDHADTEATSQARRIIQGNPVDPQTL